ncbi:unnamed protein product [Leuciscus chuanchicus]
MNQNNDRVDCQLLHMLHALDRQLIGRMHHIDKVQFKRLEAASRADRSSFALSWLDSTDSTRRPASPKSLRCYQNALHGCSHRNEWDAGIVDSADENMLQVHRSSSFIYM